MMRCCFVVSNFYSRAGNTVTLVVESNRLRRLKSTSHARTCTENAVLYEAVIYLNFGTPKNNEFSI